jgi:ribosomal protein L35AE/L33A
VVEKGDPHLNRLNNEWVREDAEKHIDKVFDAAMTGVVQRVHATEGVIEVRFLKRRSMKAGKFLAEAHPIDD